jgi:hypothetical protein
LRRDRMLSARGEDMWLLKRMAQDLFDRWQDSGESAAQALIIGYDAGLLSDALRARGVQVVLQTPAPHSPVRPWAFKVMKTGFLSRIAVLTSSSGWARSIR